MAARRVALTASLAVLAFCLAARANGPDLLVVTVRPRAAVGPRPIHIGDIADLTGGTPALREAVAALDLADAAAARAGTSITQQQISFRIRLAEVPTALFRVEGAVQSSIEPERCFVAEADVVAAARDAVLKRLPWSADDLTVQIVQPVAVTLAVDAPREAVLIKAEPHSNSMPLGRVQMDVSLWAGGSRQLAFPLYLDVRLNQKVAVCLRKIERGEALSEANVVFDRRPIEGLRDFLSSPDAVVGKRARQPLLPGRILTANDVEDDGREAASPPVVRKGEPVKLVVRLGPVNVTATGEALQDGRVGQAIRVRNVDSKHVVLGRVTERSLVEVDP